MRIARCVEEAAGPEATVEDAADQEAARFGPSVLTIGNFDGVHAGHRHLLRQVTKLAKERGLRPTAMTFDPHPAAIVAPERAPRLLTTPLERCELMQREGIEQVLILPFTPDVAKMTPEQFVADVIRGTLAARVVLVGDNFRFGCRQAGDTSTLSELGVKYGFATVIIGPVSCRGRIVSSSEVRQLLGTGNVGLAGRMLERPYWLSGEVVSGRGIGSKQTVPTLNLRTSSEVLPRNGVYVTRTHDLENGRCWNSITNIGYRPTFGGEDLSIETFLLDKFEEPVPANIRVEFWHRIRDERKFENPEALKAQIFGDVARAQSYFRRLRRWVASGLH